MGLCVMDLLRSPQALRHYANPEEWRAQGDDFRTFLSELIDSMPFTSAEIAYSCARI